MLDFIFGKKKLDTIIKPHEPISANTARDITRAKKKEQQKSNIAHEEKMEKAVADRVPTNIKIIDDIICEYAGLGYTKVEIRPHQLDWLNSLFQEEIKMLVLRLKEHYEAQGYNFEYRKEKNRHNEFSDKMTLYWSVEPRSVFDFINTFKWKDLHGKRLTVYIGVDKAGGYGGTTVWGRDSEGKYYLLHEDIKKVNSEKQ